MRSKITPFSPTTNRSRKPLWIFVLPAFGLVGLFFTVKQIYPPAAACYWRQQLADAPENQVGILLDRIADLDETGTAVLAELLASERETVAGGAKRRLQERLEQWKSLPAEESSARMLAVAETLAARTAAFGPSARGDASELATQLLLRSSETIDSSKRSRLIAACDEVFQAATAVQGELSNPPLDHARTARRIEEDPSMPPAFPGEESEAEKDAATSLDPLPSNLPSEPPPIGEQKPENVLPVENGEMPPAYFQEPSRSRSLDFSNQMAHPLQVPEGSAPNEQKSPAPRKEQQSEYLTRENPNDDASFADLRTCETLHLMRQLAGAEGLRAEKLQAELQRRGLSAAEIALSGKLFDPDPAVRKQLVAELPGMADIDASAWLLQCCKDEDAEVRHAAFSLLATSTNPLLLKKLKISAEHDSDVRIKNLAERIRVERRK
jgi:hypothetical protein